MRRTSSANGLLVKAYSGTTGVLLAFDLDVQKRDGFLGFAISRKTLSGRFRGRIGWLQGILDFPGTSKRPGELLSSAIAPIQKFRWSDYAVHPGTRYAYTVQPMYASGRAAVTALRRRTYLEAGPTIDIETQAFDGEDAIIFNRAVASSQAFARRFPDLDDEIEAARRAGTLGDKTLPQAALDWLSRGMVERIEGFLAEARDGNWALDVAIYEYHLPRLHRALAAAVRRGVRVRVLFHDKRNDQASVENKHFLHSPEMRAAQVFGRKTTKIMHNKFVILSRKGDSGDFSGVAVLAGSTNWTENGCYRQANVVHVSRTPIILHGFVAQFENLLRTRDDRGDTKRWINKNNPMPLAPERFVGFSPRSGLADIEALAGFIRGARRDVIFSTAFKLHARIADSLFGEAGDSILRLGVQNTSSNGITGVHRDRTAQFTAAALLPGGLEGWLKETTAKQRGNIRVHTKAVVIDVTSQTPLVISGSHNLSKSASDGNDENYLVLRRDVDVADVYLCEIMRIYDHYRFRHSAKERRKAGQPTAAPSLAGDDSWTDAYFEPGSLKQLDRLRFSGAA